MTEVSSQSRASSGDLTSLGEKRIRRDGAISPQIYTLLREAIVQNRLQPGAQIFEARLAESLGVSRTPLRAALQLLTKEGLIETRPQVGSVIAPVDRKKILSAVFCRSALETAVVRRLAAAEKPDLDSLSPILALQEECTARDDYLTFFDLDEEFHRLLAELADVPEAWSLVMSNKSHVDRARLHLQSAIPGRASVAYREHLLILDAIRARDADLAAQLMDRHVTSVLDIVDRPAATPFQGADSTDS